MKVRLLKQILKDFNDEDDLVISIEPEKSGYCGTHPFVEVDYFHQGIDWDSNKIWIKPQLPLIVKKK